MAKDKPAKWTVQKMLASLAQDRRFMSIVHAWSELSSEQKDQLEGMVEDWVDEHNDKD